MAKAQSCATVSWVNLGWTDGTTGSLSQLKNYSLSCGLTEDSQQAQEYLAGYRAGLNSICNDEIVYKVGRSGAEFPFHLCPFEKQEEVRKAYDRGIIYGQQQKWIQVLGLGISILALLIFYFLNRFYSFNSKENETKFAFVLGGTVLMLGLIFRLFYLRSIANGNYLFEEVSVSLNYVEKNLTGIQSMTGATNMTFFVFMTIWKYLLGPDLLLARALTSVLNLGGLWLFYLALKELTGRSTALLATSFAALSLYGSYLSSLAIETSWPLAFFSLTLFCYSRIYSSHRPESAFFILGLSAALGCLSYPAYTLWLAVAAPLFLIQLWADKKIKLKELGLLGLGFFSFFGPALFFHFLSQSKAPFLKGGGIYVFNSAAFLESLRVMAHDTFISAETYYLQQGGSFLEISWLGFFILGLADLVFIKNKRWAQILFFSMLTLPFTAALAPNLPGMRRAVLALYLYYLFAGHGAALFLKALQPSKKWIRWAGASLIFVGLGLSLRMLTLGVSNSKTMVPHNIFAELIEHPEYKKWLQAENFAVIVDGRGEAAVFMKELMRAHANFWSRAAGKPLKNFTVLDATDDYLPKNIFTASSYLVVLENKQLLQFYKSRFCVADTKEIPLVNGTVYFAEVRSCRPFYEIL